MVKNSFKKEHNLLFYLIVAGSGLELINRTGIENLWIFSFFDLFEFGIFLAIFKTYSHLQKIKKYFLPALIVIIVLRVILLILDIETLNFIKSYVSILINLSLIFLSMYTLYFNATTSESVTYQYATFWLILGVLIYYSGTIFINLISFFISPTQLYNIYYVHAVANITANFLFAYSFYKKYKNSKKESFV